ncbi:MAG: hypothetical protein AAF961_11735, partial [Planctomycetota bacterium]
GGAGGAFVGGYLGQRTSHGDHGASAAVGKAAMVGRLWGTAGKLVVGAVMLAVVTIDALFF